MRPRLGVTVDRPVPAATPTKNGSIFLNLTQMGAEIAMPTNTPFERASGNLWSHHMKTVMVALK